MFVATTVFMVTNDVVGLTTQEQASESREVLNEERTIVEVSSVRKIEHTFWYRRNVFMEDTFFETSKVSCSGGCPSIHCAGGGCRATCQHKT